MLSGRLTGEVRRLHPGYRIAVSTALLLLHFLLSSCGSPPQRFPEGNIDVDSDIYVVPIGDVDEKHLYPLIPKLERRFTTKVYLALDKRMPSPDYAYDYKAKQYVAMYILTELSKVDVPEDAKILGVTNVDLFVPESDLPFIFGQAHFGRNSKAAVISTLRMDPNSYVGGKPDDELLVQRMMKEAVHELGHVFGLRNSAEPECVMYLPRDLKSLDKKTDNFCLNCQRTFRALKQPGTLSPQTDD